MLSHLHIENIAVIEKMDILFGAGLNLLTGETGAGKSIVIDALGAVLGGRTSRDLIRTGATTAQASAVFWQPGDTVLQWVYDTLGITIEGDELSVSRDIMPDGRTVCRVAGKPVTVTQLRELGTYLVQVHGQHDSHALLNEDTHAAFVDAACQTELAAYQSEFQSLRTLQHQRDKLLQGESDKARRIDTLQFQLREIEDAELQPQEDELLLERKNFLKNAHKVASAVEEAYACLYGDDSTEGVHDSLSQASRALSSVSHLHPEIAELATKLEDLLYTADDIASETRRIGDTLEVGPYELEELEARLDILYRLKKKYGGTVDDVIAFATRAASELETIEHAEEHLAALEKKCQSQLQLVEKTAKTLSKSRQKASKLLQEKLQQQLSELDMEKVRFVIELAEMPFGVNGAESIRFLISTNVGEPPKPLSKVASGGELSRVMLALMNVLAENDDVPTMVFDEVDTGISGRAAQKVAEKLGRVSMRKQVLCVTHLPQIAAMADTHFHIHKDVEADRTVTRMQELDKDARILEIARIIGGAAITEVTMRSAAELIDTAAKTKTKQEL